MDAMVERDESLGAGDAEDGLNLAVEKLHQMLIVAGKQLDEHGVGTGGEMALHHFGNFLELWHHFMVHGTALKIHTYEGACAVAKHLGADIVA